MGNLGLVALACGLIIGLGAIGACIGIGVMVENTSRPQRGSRN